MATSKPAIFRFKDLPTELQDDILDYALVEDRPITLRVPLDMNPARPLPPVTGGMFCYQWHNGHKVDERHKLGSGLLLVSRDLGRVARGIFYSRNKFIVTMDRPHNPRHYNRPYSDEVGGVARWLERIGRENRNRIPGLTICLHRVFDTDDDDNVQEMADDVHEQLTKLQRLLTELRLSRGAALQGPPHSWEVRIKLSPLAFTVGQPRPVVALDMMNLAASQLVQVNFLGQWGPSMGAAPHTVDEMAAYHMVLGLPNRPAVWSNAQQRMVPLAGPARPTWLLWGTT